MCEPIYKLYHGIQHKLYKSTNKKEIKIKQVSHAKKHVNENGLNNLNDENVKLVIFDKDGTLISFHEMWAPWCEETCKRLEESSGLALANDLYGIFNYNSETRKIGKGSLAENTHEMIQNQVVDMLVQKHSLSLNSARTCVLNTWNSVNNSSNNSVANTAKSVCDVQTLFHKIRSLGLKIAICTSDSRDHTIGALKHLSVLGLIDRIVCGDDSDNVAKPSPDNVHLICSDLGVKPQNTVVIGDTPADTRMGASSNSKVVIGVLSGVCTRGDLAVDADFVVGTIEDALPIIMQYA